MIIIDEPNMPYKKKKDGDISKANKKSKHKHIYDNIVILAEQDKMTIPRVLYVGVSYCSICGKIGDSVEQHFPWGWTWSIEEWLNKYPNADIKKVEYGKHWYDIDNINEVL